MSPSPVYVCGHDSREMARLEAQGAFFRDITRGFLRTASLAPGMRVLDVGCGGGDVSLLAAEIVGSEGSVVGIDRAPEAIAVARARAERQGLRHVEFRLADVEEPALGSLAVDAVVGRFVLMHQADPAGTLRLAARCAQPGGVVAFLESDLGASLAGLHSRPHLQGYDRMLRWMMTVIEAAGAHADLGLRLGSVFRDAGLPRPRLSLHARVENGPGAEIYAYMAESVRSMRPRARAVGLGPPPIAVDGLEQALREEAVATAAVLVSPLVVGAWCLIPEVQT